MGAGINFGDAESVRTLAWKWGPHEALLNKPSDVLSMQKPWSTSSSFLLLPLVRQTNFPPMHKTHNSPYTLESISTLPPRLEWISSFTIPNCNGRNNEKKKRGKKTKGQISMNARCEQDWECARTGRTKLRFVCTADRREPDLLTQNYRLQSKKKSRIKLNGEQKKFIKDRRGRRVKNRQNHTQEIKHHKSDLLNENSCHFYFVERCMYPSSIFKHFWNVKKLW